MGWVACWEGGKAVLNTAATAVHGCKESRKDGMHGGMQKWRAPMHREGMSVSSLHRPPTCFSSLHHSLFQHSLPSPALLPCPPPLQDAAEVPAAMEEDSSSSAAAAAVQDDGKSAAAAGELAARVSGLPEVELYLYLLLLIYLIDKQRYTQVGQGARDKGGGGGKGQSGSKGARCSQGAREQGPGGAGEQQQG